MAAETGLDYRGMDHAIRVALASMAIGKPATGSNVNLLRLAIFASGDFAFNLFWQSTMIYLLYYYTEALHLSVHLAAVCYAVALGWDGVISLLIGMLFLRADLGSRSLRCVLAGGIVPLGIGFALAYLPPPVRGTAAFLWLLTSHVLFRTCYALTNIPYLALSARISRRADDRTLVAGGRMLAGTLAAVTVAWCTVPLGRALAGREGASAFLAAALAFATIACVILAVVAATYRDGIAERPSGGGHSPPAVWTTWHFPAFRWFAAATVLMIVPMNMVDRSVLYYFTYNVGDEVRGRLTLGAMMAVSGVAVPLWMVLARRTALRKVWMIAIASCLTALVAFIVLDPVGVMPVQFFLIAMQAGGVGLGFGMWAMLPEVLDDGRRAGRAGGEAVAYGWLALLQRISIGLGTLLLGFGFGGGGIRAGGAWLRLSLTVVPLGFLALSGVLMLLNPYARRYGRDEPTGPPPPGGTLTRA